ADYLAQLGYHIGVKILREWLIGELEEYLASSPNDSTGLKNIRGCARTVAEYGDELWINKLYELSKVEGFYAYCREILVNAETEIGFDMLYQEINGEANVNTKFLPMVLAMRRYPSKSGNIIKAVLEIGDPRLTKRLSELLPPEYKGKSWTNII
ncbi:hypothetical protein, partial [Neptuniibacter sp.]|uniref:hypothetical protein n=1 Tax=Neptuniibacter sp. TaxID=1962643 RepID=UPI00260BD44D